MPIFQLPKFNVVRNQFSIVGKIPLRWLVILICVFASFIVFLNSQLRLQSAMCWWSVCNCLPFWNFKVLWKRADLWFEHKNLPRVSINNIFRASIRTYTLTVIQLVKWYWRLVLHRQSQRWLGLLNASCQLTACHNL